MRRSCLTAICAAQVDVVVSLRNLGSEPVNITYIAGSVNLVQLFAQFQQNLSVAPYNYPVSPGQEVSLPYAFQLAPQLGAAKYQGAAHCGLSRFMFCSVTDAASVALTLLYTTSTGSYGDTFFNRTLELADAVSEFKALPVVGVLFSVGAVAYLAHSKLTVAEALKKSVQAGEATPGKKAAVSKDEVPTLLTKLCLRPTHSPTRCSGSLARQPLRRQ